MTLPTEDQTRDALGISFQERRIKALMIKASSSETVTLGNYLHGGGGLQLKVLFYEIKNLNILGTTLPITFMIFL